MDIIHSDVIVLLILSSPFLIVTILMHSGEWEGLSDMFGGTSTRFGGKAVERSLDRITSPGSSLGSATRGSPGMGPVKGPSTDCQSRVEVAGFGRRAR
jgi:preprotein translocase subunit SecG